MNRLAFTVTSSPIQRVASTRMKCPLEKSSTSPGTARTRLTTRSARAAAWAGDSPPGTAVAEQFPIGALRPDFGSAVPLILTIVPFDQIRVDFSDSSKASQLARAPGALQRARKHLGKTQSAQPFLEAARIALATFCQRQVGKSRVLTRESPSGFPMPGKVNYRKHLVHTFTRSLGSHHPNDGFW